MKTKKVRSDIFKNKPWRTQDEYFELARKHQLWGDQLEKELKRLGKVKIPPPTIKVPRGISL